MSTRIIKEDEQELIKQQPSQTTASQPVTSAQNNNTNMTYTAPRSNTYTRSATVQAADDYLKQVKEGGYNTQWSQTLDQLVNEYMGRGAFEYNADDDVQWQQAKSQGLREANLAMKNSMAQAATLSGGYGNSYAATVGNQVYQQGVADIMALAPEYYQAAYQRYRDEGDQMLQNISLAQSMDESEYQRWADEYSRALSEAEATYARDYGEFSDQRSYDYQLSRDEISDERYNTEWEHQLEREGIEDQRYNTEWAYQQERDTVSDERYESEWQHQLDREYIEDGRYDTEEKYAALVEQYNALIKERDDAAELDEKEAAAVEAAATSIEVMNFISGREEAIARVEDGQSAGEGYIKDNGKAIKSAYLSGALGSGNAAKERLAYLFAYYGFTEEQANSIMGWK